MTKILGVDISEHNGNVDFAKMKADGVKFVMLRSSWGHFEEDAKVRDNVKKCKAAGMPYGFYHYSYADTEANAKTEASKFVALCKELGGATYPLCLDMEDADGWKKENGVGDSMNIKTIQIFKDAIEGAGEYMTLYMSKSWFDRLTPLNKTLINSIDAWLAHWGVSEPSMDCGMWQYTSDGDVNGSSARTDMNYAYIDYPTVIANMKGTDAPAEKPSTSKPASTTKHKVGETVTINGVYTSSTSTTKLTPAVKSGKITKIIADARNPYLLNDGDIGWVNDDCIVSKTSSSTSIKVGDKVTPIKAVSYDGVSLISEVTKNKYTVIEIKGDRVVLGDGLNTAFKKSNLKK